MNEWIWLLLYFQIMSGGKVPKSYYLKGRTPPHKLTEHEIGRGASLEIKYKVTKPEGVFRYVFLYNFIILGEYQISLFITNSYGYGI